MSSSFSANERERAVELASEPSISVKDREQQSGTGVIGTDKVSGKFRSLRSAVAIRERCFSVAVPRG